MIKNKLLLLPILFIFFSISYAQDYESILGTSSTSWNIARTVPDEVLTDSIFTTGETSIGNHTYQSVGHANYTYGHIREDIQTGKVWFYSATSNTEYLIMDLSLAVGDPFVLNIPGTEQDSTVLVESVYFDVNGKKHITLDFDLYMANEKLTFIEGVGPNAGILFLEQDSWDYFAETVTYLLCAHKDEVQTFSNTTYDGDCNLDDLGTGIDRSQDIPWSLYPDPFEDFATLSFESLKGKNVSLIICDITGKPVKTVENITEGQTSIQRNNLPQGLYFFKLQTEGKQVASGKMVIR